LYPFGLPRNEYRRRQVEENYKFTQKERDRESGLHYFEARYLAGRLSKFVTADLKYANPDSLSAEDLGSFLSNPQEINVYAYALNNPIRYVDPTGFGFLDDVFRPYDFKTGRFDPDFEIDWEETASVPFVMAKDAIFGIMGVNTSNAPGYDREGNVVPTHPSLSYGEHAKNIALIVGGGKLAKDVGGAIFGGKGSTAVAAEGKAVSHGAPPVYEGELAYAKTQPTIQVPRRPRAETLPGTTPFVQPEGLGKADWIGFSSRVSSGTKTALEKSGRSATEVITRIFDMAKTLYGGD
jgi:RHS repeat-associated protein